MRKVIVIGCPGSGKSTFSRELHTVTGIPLYHLDMMYWAPDCTNVSKEIFRDRLSKALDKEAWIIDGNYLGTMERRMELCDTVFFLDYPTELCIEGVRARKGKKRSDIPCILPEDEDEEFIEFIKGFNSESRPLILEYLSKYSQKDITIFKERAEADRFLAEISQK